MALNEIDGFFGFLLMTPKEMTLSDLEWPFYVKLWFPVDMSGTHIFWLLETTV